MRNVGLHLRFKNTITEILDQALDLELSIIQCFFTDSLHKRYIKLTTDLIHEFKRLSAPIKRLYAHGSYLINLAEDRDHYVLKRELDVAKQLGFQYLVLHPGAVKKGSDARAFQQGLECVARTLNKITKEEKEIGLILENTAFGGNVIGGDLSHFEFIFTRLDFPDRVKFCLDTAHAYAYGYQLSAGLHSFIDSVKTSVMREFIQLMHLNNSATDLGSKMDSHAVLTQGKISVNELQLFMTDPIFADTDIIIEMPEVSREVKKEVMRIVSSA